jgi:hypothetical protein
MGYIIKIVPEKKRKRAFEVLLEKTNRKTKMNYLIKSGFSKKELTGISNEELNELVSDNI